MTAKPRRLLGPITSSLIGLAGMTSFVTTASAQSFNNVWLEYVNETPSRLNLAPTNVSSIAAEIDFATGDLNKDGLTDLVVARKEPFTSGGKRPNLLLMNENGVLVDRTALYASASDVPGDQGFLTPTNDRDVRVADVTGDGWPDVITCVVISGGDPKHISHPRVYVNLGDNQNGDWLGLRFETTRIPQIMVGASASFPNGCAILVGDVTGDGAKDLYIVDYDNGDTLDTQDRLLVNDGNGFFTDQSTLSMTAAMLDSGFGTAGSIADFNGDGVNDVLKAMAASLTIAYNKPTQIGKFGLFESVYGGSVYNVDSGDLNNDGRLDFAVSDDGNDAYRYNTGTDVLGRAIWASDKFYQFLSGGDDSIGGNVHIVDLDKDGWNDSIHADVDVDIPGCERRLHIYHNPGGTAGALITLREERENATSTSWLGAKGLKSSDLGGTYDTAALDIEGDGDLDLVIGRCSGTYVYVNVSAPKCQPIAVPTSLGNGHLSVCGQLLWTGNTATLSITGGPPSGVAVLLVGFSGTTAPAFGGQVLLPFQLSAVLPLNAAGSLSFPVAGGGGTVPGVNVYVQGVLAVPATSTVTDLTEVLRLEFHS